MRRPQLPAEGLPKHGRKHRWSSRFVAAIEAPLYEPEIYFNFISFWFSAVRMRGMRERIFTERLPPQTHQASRYDAITEHRCHCRHWTRVNRWTKRRQRRFVELCDFTGCRQFGSVRNKWFFSDISITIRIQNKKIYLDKIITQRTWIRDYQGQRWVDA